MTRELVNMASFSAELVLAVLGMAIIVSMMNVFNLAHAQFILLGATGFYVLTDAGLPVALAIPLAILAVGAVGGGIEIVVVRRLYTRPMAAVLATFGVGLVIVELVRLGLGNSPRQLAAPIGGTFQLGSYQGEVWRLVIIGIAIVVVLATWLFIQRTRAGLYMRAALTQRDLARAVGLRINRVFALTFALGTALAALAGIAIAPLTAFSPTFGAEFLVLSFLAVMVGGAGTFVGPIIGAVVLGVAYVTLQEVMTPVSAQVAVVVGAVIVMRLRPRGLVVASAR
jgi:branched-chain amino acid transport system permease protein